jgi:hypothetical protein
MKSKSIIVVGTAASILNKKNGSKIDNFDCVIKSARILNYSGYEDYVGMRADTIWLKYRFLPHITEINRPFQGDILFLHEDIDTYYDGFQNCSYLYKDEFFFNRFYIDYCFERLRENYNIKVNNFISEKIYYKTCADLKFYDVNSQYEKQKLQVPKGAIPSAGIRVLYFLTKILNLRNICVTGFNFFKTRNYWDPDPYKSALPNCHVHFKELIFYKSLLKQGIIYEL